MAVTIKKNLNNTKHEAILREFVEENGYFIVYSDDNNFVKLFQNVVYKQLSIPQECVYSSSDTNAIYNELKTRYNKGMQVILFIEREMNRSNNNEFIKLLKQNFDKISIIVLTEEVDKSVLIYLHELGSDNFITKPLSMNTIIEKVANTIKPPGKMSKLIGQAKDYVEQGKYQEALQLSDEILEIKSNSPAALMVRGDAYKAMGESDKAVDAYEKAHESEKMYLEPIKKLYEFYEQQGDKHEQKEKLKKLDELSPLNVERKLNIGELELTTGNNEEANKYFQDALKSTKKEAKDKVSSMAVDIAEKVLQFDPEKAEEYFRAALNFQGDSLSKGDVKTFNRLGIALRKQKKPKEAIQEYLRALQYVPDDENIYYNMAMAYLEGKDYEMASSSIKKAININNDFYRNSEVVSYNIGVIFMLNNQKEKAREFFNYALKVNPEYEPARKRLSALNG